MTAARRAGIVLLVAFATAPGVASAASPPEAPAAEVGPASRRAKLRWATLPDSAVRARLRQASRLRAAGVAASLVGPPTAILSVLSTLDPNAPRAPLIAGFFGGAALTVAGPALAVGGFGRAYGTLPPGRRPRPRGLAFAGVATWFVGAFAVPGVYSIGVDWAPATVPTFYLTGLALITAGTSDAIVLGRRTRLEVAVAPTLVAGGVGAGLTGRWGRR